MLRQVKLPPKVRGSLFLTAMPGRYESYQQFMEAARTNNVSRVVRLSPLDEVQKKSSCYYEALTNGKVPWQDTDCAMPDFGIPADEDLFVMTVRRVADWLRGGENVAVHCGAGIGRTGMFAVCTLVALGMSQELAEENVSAAGSGAEAKEQRAFVRRTVIRLTRDKQGLA
jgi:protein-tyrosine phosphatase